MRIPSGVTDQYIYFVAVDATDYVTRETGLATWTVVRSRNGAADVTYTTPTITQIDAVTMPGVYALLLDEDMTLDAGDQSQEVCVHITHAGMAPVTRTFELYRPSVTAGGTLTVTSGLASANVTQIDGDTGPADNLGRIAGDTGTGSYIYRESDTGGFADAIWAKDIHTLTAFALDTGIAQTVWRSSTSTFTLDTGVAQTVWRSSTSTFTGDTGSVAYAQGRLMAVRTDTGAAHLDQGRLGVIADSGVLAAVLDTGKVASAVWTSHATRTLTAFALDTGVADSVWKYTDTDARRVNVRAILDDTGAAAHLQQALASSDHILADVQKVDGDTGAATHLQQAAAANEHLLSDIERVDGDTGAGDVLGKFAESKDRKSTRLNSSH